MHIPMRRVNEEIIFFLQFKKKNYTNPLTISLFTVTTILPTIFTFSFHFLPEKAKIPLLMVERYFASSFASRPTVEENEEAKLQFGHLPLPLEMP